MAKSDSEPKDQVPATPRISPLKGLMPLLVISVGIAAVAAGGGYVTGLMLTRSAQAQALAPIETPAVPATATEEHFYYKIDPPIMANLNEPRMARYIRTSPTLVIRPTDKDAATTLLEGKMPEVRAVLGSYLSDCTPDNVRGSDNLKRMQREIMERLNDKLWPDQRPLIVDIILEDVAVQ